MSLWPLFEAYPGLFTALAAVLGLVVGSFLNVVIHRLPKMMEQAWRTQCQEFLEGAKTAVPETPEPPFDLLRPGSHCPHCDRPVRPWENVPILSYLWLRGRCAGCGGPISLRYPLTEGLSGLLAAIVAWQLGPGWAALAVMALTWALLALAVIDLDHHLLPDSITLPFLWLGLILSLVGLLGDLRTSLIGAIAGYLALWSVYVLFKWATGKEGMGHGDFKLLAMLGAWVGWPALPLVILLSSVVGAVVGLTLIVALGRDRGVPLPFGPYLAAAGWITLLWGDTLTQAYLRSTGF